MLELVSQNLWRRQPGRMKLTVGTGGEIIAGERGRDPMVFVFLCCFSKAITTSVIIIFFVM